MHIIAVSLGTAFSIPELLPHVSPERRMSSSRLKREDDVRRSLIGDILARMFAMDMEGMRNDEIRFDKGVFGKPRLSAMREPWDYNLSHSGKWVAGIVSRKGQRVGIDIQKMAAINPALARYSLSPEEMEQYQSLKSEAQIRYYYDLWTRKESYLKMEGIGLTIPIRSVFSEQYALKYEQSVLSDRLPDHAFRQYPVDPGYVLTACSTDFRFPDQYLVVRAKDLAEVFLRRCRLQAEQSASEPDGLTVL
ncbi:4'-phosphopantetheinyl transferase superfamily protein [Paenibacillus sp. FSL R10-2199]|uniref:4'-phosphopantetheinyl transferase family protein n=1 Tax=Paenibacillus sp. FSL R10-2199 TaxID=2975348 RepID=UPI0030FCA384